MSETLLHSQKNPMENPISGTDDCDFPTPRGYASSLVDSSPPDKPTETGEPWVCQGGDQINSPRAFDTFTTPGIPAFRNSYPHSATYSHESFSHPDARPGSLPALVGGAAPVYMSQDEISHLVSPQAHRNPSFPPQGTPSFQLASNTRPPLGTATFTGGYIGGASDQYYVPNMGQHHHSSPPFQPAASPGYGSNVMLDNPPPHPTPDPMVQGMRHMRLDSQASSSPHPGIASQQPSFISPPTDYAEQRYASADTIEASGRDHSLPVPTSAYGSNDYPTQYPDSLENGMRSWGEQMSTWTHREAASGHSYLPTPPSYSNMDHQSGEVTATLPYYGSPRTMMLDQMPDPRFSLNVYFPSYAHYGQAAPAIMHAADEGNITAGSFASSDDGYNQPLQQPAIWDGRMLPSTTITHRAHRGTPSWQYHHRTPSLSTRAIHPSDVAVNALPRNMRPVQHGNQHGNPRHSNASSISPQSEFRVAFQGTPSASDGGHFVASSSASADEGRTDCSPPPATRPPTTGLNPQKLLRRVLGPTPRLRNEALIKLVLLILHAPFYRMHEMEPTGDSKDGMALLRQIQSIPGCPPGAFDASGDSIFTLFVSRSKFRCLICWSFKQSMVRAIGCVRSHLGHKPFPCLGEDGCKSCPKGQIVKRFFTASLLHDHCSKQARAIECTYCGHNFASNIKRHWESRHKHTPFPYEDYPNYQHENE